MTQPAYQKKVQVKSTGSTSYDILPGTSATLDLAGDVLDDTDFRSSGWRSRVRGLKDWTVSATSNYDTTSNAFTTVRSAWLNNTRIEVQYLPDGSKGYQGIGQVESFSHSGDIGGLEQVDISIQADGPMSTV